MNQFLRERILRKLDTLSDERLYQVLDYVEFLESKYAERQAPSPGIFTRFAETVEDQLRAGRISASAISETMNLMNRAMGVLNGVAAAGKSVASDLVGAAGRAGERASTPAQPHPHSPAQPPMAERPAYEPTTPPAGAQPATAPPPEPAPPDFPASKPPVTPPPPPGDQRS
jgi:hypothetical protein